MKNCYIFIFLFIISNLIFSCGPDITPAYLIITEEDFSDCLDVSVFNITHDQNYDPKELNAIKQQNFSDVLVSLNGTELGYWKLPCTIPLLPNYSGENNIRVIPCVRSPHFTVTTLQYLFVDPIEQFMELNKEGEYKLSPFSLKYVPTVSFPVLEVFEQSTDFKPRTSEHPATIEIIDDDKLLKKIGKISIIDTAVFFDVVSSFFPLLGGRERQFWEISYKSINGQINIHLGFEGSLVYLNDFFADVAVLPSTEGVWKKVYIDISDIVSKATSTAPLLSTRLRMTGLKDIEDIKAEFYFENIKLITMYAPNL